MNAWLLTAWGLAALVGGFGLAVLWQGRSQLSLSLGLGGALLLGAFLLPGTRPDLAVQSWGAPLVVALLGLGSALVAWRRSDPLQPAPRRPARIGTVLALLLLAAGAWLAVVGAMHLDPGRALLLEHAPLASQFAAHGSAAVHPLGASNASLPARLLGVLGGDPLLTAQVLAEVCQILALGALFGGLRSSNSHALAALLGAGALLMGTPSSWLVTTSLDQALAHLLGAGVLAVLLLGSGPLNGALAGLLCLAAARLAPEIAWPLALLAILAPWLPGTRASTAQRSWHSALALLAAVGVAWTAGAPRPGLEFSWWTALLPVGLWAAWRFEVRAALLLGMGEILVAVAGAGFGSSVLGAACVCTVAGELLGRAWDQARPGSWRVAWEQGGLQLVTPRRLLVVLAVLVLVVQGFEPAETAVNRQVILAGHKQRIPVQELARPLTLSQWVLTRGPAFGLRPQDVDLAAALARKPGRALVLTIGVESEPLLPSAVIATLAGRPLDGWNVLPGSAELEPAAELVRSQAGRQAAPGERLLLLEPFVEEEVPPLSGVETGRFRATWKAAAAPGENAEIAVDPLPGRGQILGYRVFRDGRPWGRFPVEVPARRPVLFPVPRTPGTYTLEFYLRPAGGRQAVAVPLGSGGLPALVSNESDTLAGLEVGLQGLGSRLPARSLIPFTLVLQNSTARAVDLARFESLCLELEGPDAYPEEARGRLQPLLAEAGERPGLLQPGSQVRLRALLPTPLTEGTFKVRPVLVDCEGVRVPLSLEFGIRTWRRLPPAGGR